MSEATRKIVTDFYARLDAGDVPGAAALFAERVDWNIPGATEHVPWIGPRKSRAEVAEFFRTLDRDYLERDHFTVEKILVDGPDAIAVGHLRSTVLATGRVIESPFAVRFTVEDGRITKYLMFEDSWRVAEATRRDR
ncbi:nuclear transport factor 2 family protein [Amycolatopsis anabasis]|uniref:nuclear transport factor 2 family protein n=1 Tax=Amycolatopsis anabasis TaxID=1840409 RepID=UPI00131B33BC|nr:nuclear transport factor 2 family protein [Amycolatopsis anabasis]